MFGFASYSGFSNSDLIVWGRRLLPVVYTVLYCRAMERKKEMSAVTDEVSNLTLIVCRNPAALSVSIPSSTSKFDLKLWLKLNAAVATGHFVSKRFILPLQRREETPLALVRRDDSKKHNSRLRCQHQYGAKYSTVQYSRSGSKSSAPHTSRNTICLKPRNASSSARAKSRQSAYLQ